MPQFNANKPFGESFTADNDTQAGLISQFAEFASADPPLQGTDLFGAIQEYMSPMQLVHPDIVKKLPIYQKIKVFLEKFGATVPITEESGRLVARRLVCSIWSGDEFAAERKSALEMFDNIRNGALFSPVSAMGNRNNAFRDVFGTPTSAASDADANIRSDRISSPSLRTLGNDMAKRFSSDSSKFNGEATENLNKHVDQYLRASSEMELTHDQKVKLFHHALSDTALEFYKDKIEDKVHNWGEVIRMMQDEYNTEVKMERIADTLSELHISQYENEDRSESEALQALAKDIQKLLPQAPKECRTDRFKKKTLKDATKRRKWALQVTASSSHKHFTYQQFLHKLQNSLQQHTTHDDYEEPRGSNGSTLFRESRIREANFAGQGRYSRDPKKKRNAKPSNDDIPLTCWNCEKTDCSVSKCSIPKNPERIRMNRIRYFENRKGIKLDRKTRETLFEYSCLLDSADCPRLSNSSSSDEGTDTSEDNKTSAIHHSLACNQDEALRLASVKDGDSPDEGF